MFQEALVTDAQCDVDMKQEQVVMDNLNCQIRAIYARVHNFVTLHY